MTQRYSHLSPAALVDTVRLLESRVVGRIGGRLATLVPSQDPVLDA
jgi:hypothetical protein